MGWSEQVQRSEVCSIRTFAAYAAQEAGIPYPAKTHLYASEKLVKELFELYPELSWHKLCGVIVWAKVKNKRFPHILQLLNSYRYAYADGYLDEVELPPKEDLTERVAAALETETDPAWVDRLTRTKGPGRKVVLAAWEKRIEL